MTGPVADLVEALAVREKAIRARAFDAGWKAARTEGKAWSPGFVAFLREVTAESVINRDAGNGPASTHDEWRLVQTAQRLSWLYGDERAAAILNGEDPETQADLAAWSGRSAKNRLPCAAA
jgi:hypothetical protein